MKVRFPYIWGMQTINVKLAQAELDKLRKLLTPAQIATAQARALNRTIDSAKTATSREIRNVYAIGATGLSKRMPVSRANRSKQSAELNAEARPLPIMDFKPRQVMKGVSVAITKGNRTIIKSAFIKKLPGGKMGVMARGAYAAKGKIEEFQFRKKRITPTGPDLPINELRSLSLVGAASHESVQARMNDAVENNYRPRLVHELKRISNSSITSL